MTDRSRRLILAVFLVCSFWIGSIGPVTAMPPVKRLSLPNKMVVLLSEEHSLPFVTFQLVIDGGSRRDPGGKEGLALLTAKGLALRDKRAECSSLSTRPLISWGPL